MKNVWDSAMLDFHMITKPMHGDNTMLGHVNPILAKSIV